MVTFRRITKRDNPATLAALAAKHHELLTEALALAQRNAASKPQIVREILATGTVEGLVGHLNAKVSAIRFRAQKYKRTWNSLIPWQNLEDTSAVEEAESIIDTIETNIHMTETDSWPEPPTDSRATKRRK
jgi:hypothetical protein